jgi:hypothetical protein
VFEAKFMLPWSFSEEIAAEKYMAQLQHNMWVTHLRSSVLSISNGSGHSREEFTLDARAERQVLGEIAALVIDLDCARPTAGRGSAPELLNI